MELICFRRLSSPHIFVPNAALVERFSHRLSSTQHYTHTCCSPACVHQLSLHTCCTRFQIQHYTPAVPYSVQPHQLYMCCTPHTAQPPALHTCCTLQSPATITTHLLYPTHCPPPTPHTIQRASLFLCIILPTVSLSQSHTEMNYNSSRR